MSIFFIIKSEVTSSKNLIEDDRRDLLMMRDDFKKTMRTYREKIEAFKALNLHILITVDRSNLIYLMNENIVFRKLNALKKRLVFTNRIREIKMIRRYRDLQQLSNISNWVADWLNESRCTRRQQDWNYLIFRDTELCLIFWMHCESSTSLLWLIERLYWKTKFIAMRIFLRSKICWKIFAIICVRPVLWFHWWRMITITQHLQRFRTTHLMIIHMTKNSIWNVCVKRIICIEIVSTY